MFTISFNQLIGDISRRWFIKNKRIHSSRARRYFYILRPVYINRKKIETILSLKNIWVDCTFFANTLFQKFGYSTIIRDLSGNISIIKIPSSSEREIGESVLQPPPPLTLASKRFLFVLQTKGFSRVRVGERRAIEWRGARRGREVAHGRMGGRGERWKGGAVENTRAELLHLLSEGSESPRLRELRDRDSAAITEAPLLVLTNFHRVICFNSDSSRLCLRSRSVKLNMAYFAFLWRISILVSYYRAIS